MQTRSDNAGSMASNPLANATSPRPVSSIPNDIPPDRITGEERTIIVAFRRKGPLFLLLGLFPIIMGLGFFSELADKSGYFKFCCGISAVLGLGLFIAGLAKLAKIRHSLNLDLAEMAATDVEVVVSAHPQNKALKQLTILGETKPAGLLNPSNLFATIPNGCQVRCRISRHAKFLLAARQRRMEDDKMDLNQVTANKTDKAESIASPETAAFAWTVVRNGVSSSPLPRPFPVPQDFGKNPKLTYQEAADCVASQKFVQQFDFVALCRTYYKQTPGRRGIASLAVLGVLIVAGVLWGTLRISIGPFWIAVCVGVYLAVIHSTKPESSSDAMPSLDKFALVVGAGTKLFLLPLSTTGQRFNCASVLMLDLSRLKVEALQRGRSLSVSEANGGQALLLDRFGLALMGMPKDFTFQIIGQQNHPAMTV